MAEIIRDNPYSEENTYPTKDMTGAELYGQQAPTYPPGQLDRNNPYLAAALPPLNKANVAAMIAAANNPATAAGGQAITMPDATITGSRNPTGLLSTNEFANQEIGVLGDKKDITGKEAANLAAGELEKQKIEQVEAAKQAEQLAQSQAVMKKAVVDADARDVSLRQQIAAAHSKIDPERWWNNKSTGGKALVIVGQILGGLGQGLMKTGRNAVMDQTMKFIDNDIAAQKETIDNNFKAIADQHGVDNDAFNRELHKQTWENNFRTASLEVLKLDLGAAASRTQSETVKNNAEMGISALTEQQLKIRNDQYKTTQAMAAAGLANERKLQEDATKDVIKLMEKDGVNFETAQKAVYSLPRYQGLSNNPVRQELAQKQAEYNAQVANAMKGGKTREAAQAEVGLMKNPDGTAMFPNQKTPIGVVVPKAKPAGGEETFEQLQGRTVLLDGKPAVAVNKKAADDWMDYNRVKDEADRALAVLQRSKPKLDGDHWAGGDPAAYNAARGKLIEVLPQILGFNRAPSHGQLTTTFGPETIPEYNHWYAPTSSAGKAATVVGGGAGTVLGGPLVGLVGAAAGGRIDDNRLATKLDDLALTLNTVDKAIRGQTFQPQETTPSNKPNPVSGPPTVIKSRDIK